jgi:hypothetical protein
VVPKSLRQKMSVLLLCLLVLALLAACGAREEPASQEAPAQEQVSSEEAEVPDEEVFLEDLIFPGAEFLFEVDGIGGPMMPYRFYAVPNASTEEAADFYKERLPWFSVEADEVSEGYPRLMLAHPDPFRGLDGVDAEDLADAGSKLDGAVLGVEVDHSTAHANQGLSRLLLAIQAHGRADDIPADTTIVILEYFKNPY